MSSPHTPPDPDETPESSPPPERGDWVTSRAAPLTAIGMSLAFMIGYFTGSVKDIPGGFITVIGVLFGAGVAGRIGK